jgi:hypothetical protein
MKAISQPRIIKQAKSKGPRGIYKMIAKAKKKNKVA